jgi:hypothetical protein
MGLREPMAKRSALSIAHQAQFMSKDDYFHNSLKFRVWLVEETKKVCTCSPLQSKSDGIFGLGRSTLRNYRVMRVESEFQSLLEGYPPGPNPNSTHSLPGT